MTSVSTCTSCTRNIMLQVQHHLHRSKRTRTCHCNAQPRPTSDKAMKLEIWQHCIVVYPPPCYLF
nr:odorant receptor [Semanotus bifasciatus]